jgi:hypothetical protein
MAAADWAGYEATDAVSAYSEKTTLYLSPQFVYLHTIKNKLS